MSLILDALKRSRGDASVVPGVDTYHALEDLRPAWQRFLPWLALAASLVLIAGLLLDRFGLLPNAPEIMEQQDGTVVAAAQPAAATVSVKPQTLPPTVPVAPAAEVSGPAPASKPSSPVQTASAVKQSPAAARPAQNVAQRPSSAPVEEPEQAVDAAVADLYRARQRDTSAGSAGVPQATPATAQRQPSTPAKPAAAPARPAETEQPIDIERMLEQARDEMDTGEYADHPAQFISSLSQQTKNPIPTILYQRHDYSGQAAQARVVMNGKTLRVGGSPAPGVKLEEILPNSAVLSYRGTQFRLRALNSWVNL